MLGNLKVTIDRDVAKNPRVITINRDNRIVKVDYSENELLFSGDSREFPSISEVLQLAFPYELESQSRPEWYDRNPITKVATYAATLAPHAQTYRTEYVCPADKVAMVEQLQAEVMRITQAAPAAVGEAILKINITPVNDTYHQILRAHILNDTIGVKDSVTSGGTITLQTGESLRISTQDASGGGTIAFFYGYKITEFDA